MGYSIELDVYFEDTFDDIMEEGAITLEPYGSFPARRIRQKFKGTLKHATEVDIYFTPMKSE
jgi:hypothetical protein